MPAIAHGGSDTIAPLADTSNVGEACTIQPFTVFLGIFTLEVCHEVLYLPQNHTIRPSSQFVEDFLKDIIDRGDGTTASITLQRLHQLCITQLPARFMVASSREPRSVQGVDFRDNSAGYHELSSLHACLTSMGGTTSVQTARPSDAVEQLVARYGPDARLPCYVIYVVEQVQ
jgi:hypothetical protein